jgi:TolB-like protein/tetratricopeptide (TPR) repeat protein/DNA-binding winged helix-turn-helix (wHTH) protein
MDTADLNSGFRLGAWLVEPHDSRISGPAGTRILSPPHMALLQCLAEHHGESVSRQVLAERAWPGRPAPGHLLHAAIRALREALGSGPHDQSCIVNVTGGGYALIAHFEPLAPATPFPAAAADRAAQGSHRTPLGGLQWLVVELRRRNVFKVAGAYLVGSWIVLQVAEVTFQPLRLPDWWMTALTILAVLGLPIVVVLAWSYEITAGGIVLDNARTQGVKLPRARRAIAPAMVAGVALMAGVTGYAWWRSLDMPAVEPAGLPDPGYPSVAVLPMVDMSPAGGITYLGDGLSEELSARLAQIPGLRVASRTSAFEFKDRNMDVRRIGESLGVRHVLEGSVRRDGDNLRVTVQLIDAASGYHVWAGSYDRGWSDVIAIQDDIARSITEALSVVLAPEEAGRRFAGSPDVRAFDPYLAGLALLRQSGDMSKMHEAERRFGEAIDIAPSFARAHAGLCQVGVRLYRRTRDPADVARAETSCRRALELDPSLVDTEKALAALYLASGRLPESEAAFRRLVSRYPNDADGHMGLGQVLQAQGRPADAERSLRAAVQAEPAYWAAFAALGAFLFASGQVDEAVDAFREVTELTPSSANAYSNLGGALQLKGDLEAAAAAFRRSLQIEPSSSAYSNLGTVHYFLGQFDQAVANYERATALTSQDHSLWGNLADALWHTPGRREEAAGHYRRAIALGERELESAPLDGLLLAQLGYYHGRVGDTTASRGYLERAVAATAAGDPYVRYYAALAAADRGDLAAARESAAEAVRLGYPETLLRADPSLAILRPVKAQGGDT